MTTETKKQRRERIRQENLAALSGLEYQVHNDGTVLLFRGKCSADFYPSTGKWVHQNRSYSGGAAAFLDWMDKKSAESAGGGFQAHMLQKAVAKSHGQPEPIVLSDDQQLAADAILAWWKKRDKLIRMGGFAGSGKTTVCKSIIQQLRRASEQQIRVAYCAFTGKAAQVLSSKIELEDGDTCSTIHSLIYLPVVKDGVVKHWKRNPSLEADLIVVDEASMVDEFLFKDLQKFGIPILAVGDHGQLPPVKGDFNLMDKPDIRLEKIHRQAEGNAIIGVSVQARRTGAIKPGEYGPGVEKRIVPSLFPALEETFDQHALYLCAFNSTRCYLNKFYRQRMNIASAAPVKGEKVICLRNNREAGIFNGQTGILKEIKSDGAELYLVKIQMDDGTVFEGDVSRFQFGQRDVPKDWNVYKMGNLFDFGYAVTVHKAQGSQARKVILVEERGAWNDDYHARWVYTAVTRAAEELLVLSK